MLLFDGEKLSVVENIGKFVLSATILLSDDFVEFIAFKVYIQETSVTEADLDTTELSDSVLKNG